MSLLQELPSGVQSLTPCKVHHLDLIVFHEIVQGRAELQMLVDRAVGAADSTPREPILMMLQPRAVCASQLSHRVAEVAVPCERPILEILFRHELLGILQSSKARAAFLLDWQDTHILKSRVIVAHLASNCFALRSLRRIEIDVVATVETGCRIS